MPTRYLKPGICDSETIDRCSPIAECLFYRLLVNVDDFGRLDARPAVVRAKCFPLKETTLDGIQNHLDELQHSGLIKLYKSDGCVYLQMCKWDNIPRAKESKCPSPTDDCIQLHATVNGLHTVLPVTETVTVTDNHKPELKPKTSQLFELPDWIDREMWDLWMQTRKGKKMIPAQMQAQIKKLQKWRNDGLDHCKALADAAAAGWLGMVEPKPKNKADMHFETLAGLTGQGKRTIDVTPSR